MLRGGFFLALFALKKFCYFGIYNYICGIKQQKNKQMENTFSVRAAQAEILNMMSYLKDENTYIALKKVISDFFARRADEELDRLWDAGILNEEKIESFKNLHMRTPYK